MSLIKKFGRKLALGVICSVAGTAAYATPFGVQISFYGEEEPPLANIWLGLDLIDGNGQSDSSVKIWSTLPVSSRVGGVTTVAYGSEYRMDDSTGSSSLQFATRNRGILFYMDWAGLSVPASNAQVFDKLTLKLLDAQGKPLPTSDKNGILATVVGGRGIERFSTSAIEIDAQIPAGPFPPPARVPEPGSLGMMALGMSCLALIARRRRNSR